VVEAIKGEQTDCWGEHCGRHWFVAGSNKGRHLLAWSDDLRRQHQGEATDGKSHRTCLQGGDFQALGWNEWEGACWAWVCERLRGRRKEGGQLMRTDEGAWWAAKCLSSSSRCACSPPHFNFPGYPVTSFPLLSRWADPLAAQNSSCPLSTVFWLLRQSMNSAEMPGHLLQNSSPNTPFYPTPVPFLPPKSAIFTASFCFVPHCSFTSHVMQCTNSSEKKPN